VQIRHNEYGHISMLRRVVEDSGGKPPLQAIVNRVFVHGGVSGRVRPELPSLSYAPANATAASGAMDAVEAAVRALEDDPALNAGYGSVLNRSGRLELDAGIADGFSGRVGGVAGVRVRHPISLARYVLEKTPHVLVTGEGAAALAAGFEPLHDTTRQQRQRWEHARRQGLLDLDEYGRHEHVDTVGAVALDGRGHLAAGSSTGGVFGQMPGRVGDSPIFGAGIYASRTSAVVGTGVGELFLSSLACWRAGRLIEEGAPPQEACARVIELLGAIEKVSAGLLAIDGEGRMGAAFRGGAWAVEGGDGPVAAQQIA
jgi:beta-aspartyl-peptidase (threonine type)